MSIVTVTFDESTSLPPLTARPDEVKNTVELYLQREFPAVDEVQYDAHAGLGVAFVGQLLVSAFRTAPLGGAA